MFFVNFDRICREKGTTPTAVVRKLGFSASKITAWKRGSIPKKEMLSTLAAHLNVDVSEFFAADGVSKKKVTPETLVALYGLETDENLIALTNDFLDKTEEVNLVMNKLKKILLNLDAPTILGTENFHSSREKVLQSFKENVERPWREEILKAFVEDSDLAMLQKIQSLPPEKRKAVETLLG